MALVFVVDDETVTVEAVAAVVEGAGHQVRMFTSPEAALESGREDAPDVVITDFAMPG